MSQIDETTQVCTREQIDPRGPRFGGAITTVVLAAALVLVGTTAGTVLVAWQTAVFALGALVGLHAQPYGIVFRKVIRPRLAPPSQMEDVAPPRFAQAVGLGFMLIALVATLIGATVITTIAIAFALAAAFLNAAFDFCLGCEMYLTGRRLVHR
jgi:predicted phage tail protein